MSASAAARLAAAAAFLLPAPPATEVLSFAGDDADPGLCGPPRLSFVHEADTGARDRGLWPNMPILVAPCDRFGGAGYYQLAAGGTSVVRHAFRINAISIRLAQMMRDGSHQFTDLSPEMFNDAVCGLVLGSLDIVCRRLAAELHVCRQVRS